MNECQVWGSFVPFEASPYAHCPLPSPQWWYAASQGAKLLFQKCAEYLNLPSLPPSRLASPVSCPKVTLLEEVPVSPQDETKWAVTDLGATFALGQLQVHLEGMTPWEDWGHLSMGVWCTVLGQGPPCPIRPGDSL